MSTKPSPAPDQTRVKQPASKGLKKTLRDDYPQRRLVLVDIENLAGASCLDTSMVAKVRELLIRVLNLQPGDLVVVGSSRFNYPAVMGGWPTHRHVFKVGRDAADRALLAQLDPGIPLRFGEVVLGSGDHIFADAVKLLRCRGVAVTVVALAGSLSRRLEAESSRVIILPRPK